MAASGEHGHDHGWQTWMNRIDGTRIGGGDLSGGFSGVATIVVAMIGGEATGGAA